MQIEQLNQEVNTLQQQKQYADKLIVDRMVTLKQKDGSKQPITQEQLQKLQREIQSSREKADEIISHNEKLKGQNKKIKECFDVMAKKIIKMNAKVAKFSK